MISAVVLTATAGVSSAADDCLSFFWTGSNHAVVERYKPHYLIGQGLEDVGMSHIGGTRIRYKWSTQTAACFTSSNRYGYFFHPDFERTACTANDSCTGTRFRTLSERLTDVRNVIQQLGQSTTDATYRQNLRSTKTATYLVVDAMEAGKVATENLYGSLVLDYNQLINQLTTVINLVLPLSIRLGIYQQLCAPDNVARLEELETACFDNGTYCDLQQVFDAINSCAEFQDGATLDSQLAELTAIRGGIIAERDALGVERDAVTSLWTEIQAMRGTP